MHPQEIVALLHELLMQVGQYAGDLLVEDIEADMLVGIEQGLARDIGQRRNPGEPVVATTVGQIEMQPQPAVQIGEFRIGVGDVELRRGAVVREAIGGDDADIGKRLVHPLTRAGVKQAMRQRSDKLMTTTAHRSSGDKLLIRLGSSPVPRGRRFF